MSIALELFLTGITLGIGPCSIFCLPILVPYVAGTKEGWRDALKATLVFSLSRLFAYILMGLIVGLFGEILINFLSQSRYGLYIWIVGGLYISLLGAVIVLGKEPKMAFCRLLRRHTVDDSLKSMVPLGFIVGITPCAPLFGILTYIALSVKGFLLGAFYALCFGVGTSIVTPIIVLGIIAGVVPRLIFKTPKIYEIFKKSCGVILLLLGAKMIVSQILYGSQYW